MWTLVYNREANTYALDSYPYNEEVLMAIESLTLTQSGLPDEKYTELDTEYYVWRIAQHTVVFRRILEQMTIRILIIKPD